MRNQTWAEEWRGRARVWMALALAEILVLVALRVSGAL
jgi:hypothetical protein